MTHTKGMDDSEGKFTPVQTNATCPKCKSGGVTAQCWESNDGAYEDYKFKCADCKHTWWVEGADA